MKFALLGEHLSHSYSKLIHEHFGLYSYDLCEVAPENLPMQLKSSAYDGYNVTIPYKRDVIPFCAELTATAREIGAVNTLYKKGGAWAGDNTDAFGMTKMLEGLDVRGKNALILGSGGTSRTAQYVLEKLGAKSVLVVSRTGEVNYDNVYERKETEIILNTTPVGMYPRAGAAALDCTRFPNLSGAADCVYNPAWTKLLQDAKACGARVAGGLVMLVCQAAKSAEHFSGRKISDQMIAETLLWLSAQTGGTVQ